MTEEMSQSEIMAKLWELGRRVIQLESLRGTLQPGSETPSDFYQGKGEWQRQTEINMLRQLNSQLQTQIQACKATVKEQQIELRNLRKKQSPSDMEIAARELQSLVDKMRRELGDEDGGLSGVREPRR